MKHRSAFVGLARRRGESGQMHIQMPRAEAAEFGADSRVCALPITDCTRRLTETLVCLREQSSRRVVATFLEMVRESLV